jgi:hypothetical protein
MRISLQKQSRQPVFSNSAGPNTAAARSNRRLDSGTGHDFRSMPAFAVFGNAPKAMLSKTAIGTAGEREEQKAGAAAEHVMRMGDNEHGGAPDPLQRSSATLERDGRLESEVQALQGSGSRGRSMLRPSRSAGISYLVLGPIHRRPARGSVSSRMSWRMWCSRKMHSRTSSA